MDKISVLCITQFIEQFNTDDSSKLFNVIQEISKWFSKSVITIGELKTFNEVQKELLNIAQYIVTGKAITRRGCSKLVVSLKNMQKEMLLNMNIVLFVTPSIKIEFNKCINKVIIEDQNKCVDMAYDMQKELKYLLYKSNESVNEELKNAVDIIVTFEQLFKEVDKCFPIDDFTYDRLYLTAKFRKIEKEKSKILITGSSYAMTGLLENKMPDTAINVATNSQDLYYTLLSVKEAINRSENMDVIVISFAYYFFFTDMTDNPSDYMKSILGKVNYPIYKKLNRYKGTLPSLYKKEELPLYEAIVEISSVRDLYYNAIVQELESMQYFNEIKNKPETGILSYNFFEKSDEENFKASKVMANKHNETFDIDRGIKNRELLSRFLDNMDELNKKVILFVPPVTKFYRAGVSDDMINSYNQLVLPIVKSHKCCTFINLFNSDKFDERDFQDYDHLNLEGANKLSEIISEIIK